MAEVPISDVLCDAVEYLSKLGANLRTRSENLKDKKITKSKLKNSHAIQKAASKLLLICEISKKSLDNVEKGMKNVLNIVNASQAQILSGSDTKSSSNAKYQYFEFETYKLRISKKVPVKHYMSVKVSTASMSRKMLEKYPVYCDCKLLRLRQKKLKSRSEVSNNNSQTSKTKQQTAKRSKKLHKSDSESSVDSDNSQRQQGHDSPRASPHNKEDEVVETETLVENVDKNFLDKENEMNVSKMPREKIIKCNDQNNRSPKKQKRIVRFAEDCDSDSKSNVRDSEPSINNKDSSDNEDVVCISPVKEETKQITSDDSKDSTNTNVSDSKLKPLIKCVSINKLLKPDIVNKIDKSKKKQGPHSKSPKITTDGKTQSKEISAMDGKKQSKEITCDDKTDTFWELKRKEVLHFKSKAFHIKIIRLPKLTNDFLLKHDLQKITQYGIVLQEICNDNGEKISNKRQLVTPPPKQSTIVTSEAQKVKTTLLYESDSNDSNIIKPSRQDPTRLSSDSDCIESSKVKKKRTILNDSDSDTSHINEELINKGEEKECNAECTEKDNITDQNLQSKKDLLNDADNDITDQNLQSKKDLLNDADNDITDPNLQSKKDLLNDADDNITDPNLQSKKDLLNDADDNITDPNLQSKKDLLNDADDNITDPNLQSKKDLLNDADDNITDPNLQSKKDLLNDADDNITDPNLQSKKDLLNDIDEIITDQNLQSKRDLLNDTEVIESTFDMVLDNKKENRTSHTLHNTDSNQLQETINIPNKEIHDPNVLSCEETQSSKNNKRQRSSDDETPEPKKKHLEIDDAKKTLLTNTDSEDEDIAKTLDCIKATLLGPDSSDDDLQSMQKPEEKNPDKSDKESDTSKEDQDSNSEKDRTIRKKRKIKRTKIGASKSKARDSSSDNSDIQDDKHINGLTNLKSLQRKRRRRRSRRSSNESSSEIHTRSKKKMAKAPTICNEEILEAESASEDPSDEDVECNEEELPTVRLSELNGEGGEHLAKDDLLGDSDTSDGNQKDTEDSKKDTSEDSDNIKSKRRKANAISSDSEAGSSRRKRDRDDDVKLSDFEDSDDDTSETGKKKRKKKIEESDGSSDSNDGKKKRRRIKQVDDSDMSGSDNENEGRNKHGRKNIRKVMGKNQLEEATKKAARQEKERIARIAERQKMYNNLDFDETGKPDEVVLDKVVLDFDPETKEPLIQLDKGLVKKLKPHQANGIKFMWDACFESVKRIKKDKGSGCILAHCMGLGKTLQVISLTHTLLTHSDLTGVHRVLVVCPLSTVLNWVNEFQMWLKNTENKYEVDIYELSRFKQNSERAFQLQQWLDHGGVCVLGYEMFRNLSADNNKKFKKKMLKSFQQSLVDPGPDLVVCDEGHLLKNEKTSLSQSMNRVRTLRRIVLTGTPLQNNLKEYYCMVQFVKPNLLGKYNEYLNRFVNPITNGQYTDSTEHDIKIMKRRSHVLHKMLDGAVQRRDYGVLAPFLPPKHEYVLFITLTDVQVKLYQHYLDNYSRRPLPGKSSGFLFPDFQSLQRIWTHPLVLKYNSERYEIMQQKKRDKEEEEDSEGSLVDFIDDDSTPDESSTEDSSDDMSDVSDDSRKKKKNKSKKNKEKGRANTRRNTRANPVELAEPEPDLVEVKNENPTEWWIKLVEEEQLDDLRNSHKLVLLFDILRQCEAIGDKLLVFSQSLYSLDLIEHFLGKVDEATQEGRVDEKLGNHVGSWSPGIDYFRLDGSTSCENRSIWCKNFNREDNQRARLFLISTRAGGLGINLVAANRVVIFDVSWNPSHDVQSIFRVYRFGQKKPCYVYRFLAMGTMEEKIYERQVTKQAISKRVIDEQQIDRHYAENDLAELYKFEPEPPSPRPLPPLPKDRLFAEMLREHDKQIYKYHEHDSLLENKEEETLSEEERKAAWEDFENEKNKPPPAPFPNTWNMHNGMMGGLLAQQQQQLAYAAVAAMLRKDLPNVNEQQIRDMLPLIYNANPQMFGGYDYGLMQKMNEIYKYPQAGMMNPAMMNQVMNAGGVGGSSSLQYEPPWQRQQQQQQQMRLQQIMQHQNQMGAKFYAGGLGSRDPVAMALQQQRAREMLGGGAGGGGAPGGGAGGGGAGERRGRGRPPGPAAPRVPIAPHDVVDLDSD